MSPAVSTLVPFFHSRIMGPSSLVRHGSSSVWPTSVRNTWPSVVILGPEEPADVARRRPEVEEEEEEEEDR